MFVHEYKFLCWWKKNYIIWIKYDCYACVVNEFCNNLFMTIACVVWLIYLNDDMYVFMKSFDLGRGKCICELCVLQ
jgi:hypothetical protein